jgi:hypothetical protein
VCCVLGGLLHHRSRRVVGGVAGKEAHRSIPEPANVEHKREHQSQKSDPNDNATSDPGPSCDSHGLSSKCEAITLCGHS